MRGADPQDAEARAAQVVVVVALAGIEQLHAEAAQQPAQRVFATQAADAREDAKRTLIERAGRKEIYMLFPLVFLILPLSVLFAVFPGIFMLRLGLG